MNIVTIAIGIALVFFGIYMAIARKRQPQAAGKRQALQELFGDEMGSRIHLGTYVVIPILAGGMFIFSGMRGVSIF